MGQYNYLTGSLLILSVIYMYNIRIFNGCEVWIEYSVTRVTVRHHEACRVMQNSYLSDRISICTEEPLWILFHAYTSFKNCI